MTAARKERVEGQGRDLALMFFALLLLTSALATLW